MLITARPSCLARYASGQRDTLIAAGELDAMRDTEEKFVRSGESNGDTAAAAAAADYYCPHAIESSLRRSRSFCSP